MPCLLLVILRVFIGVAYGSENPAAEGQGIPDDLFKIRDPFKMPELEQANAAPKTDLEKYPVEAYKLVAVLTGPDRLRAMVLAPDGKTYFVSEASKIGIKSGIVKKITPFSIKVREKFVNMIGKEEDIDSEIRMPAEGRPVNKAGSESGSLQGGPSLMKPPVIKK